MMFVGCFFVGDTLGRSVRDMPDGAEGLRAAPLQPPLRLRRMRAGTPLALHSLVEALR